MNDTMKTLIRTVVLGAAFSVFLSGCVSQGHSNAARNDASGKMAGSDYSDEIDQTDVIDHTKGRPGEQLATLKLTSDFPLFENYFVAPGDMLDVVYHLERNVTDRYPITLYHTVEARFVNLPELNQTQQVLPDGTISLPYLGSYKVIGKTAEELRQELMVEYKKYLRDPELFVSIKNFNARVEQLRKDLHNASRGLSKLIKVRPDGYATFPLLGQYYVAKRSIEDIYEELQRDYNEHMAGLKLDLFMHEQSGTQVYVLGEVRKPGNFEVDRPINVLQAVARANGYTQEAETSNVVVFRRDGTRLKAHRFDIKDMDTFGAQAANFYLEPEDVLLVPRSRVSSLAQLMAEISDIAFFRGLSATAGYDINDYRDD